MTILDYIAANPGCSGGEIAAALNTPTTNPDVQPATEGNQSMSTSNCRKPRRASAAHPAAKQTPLIPVPGLSCTLWREAFAHL